MEKPVSPSCERNKGPILDVLRGVFAASTKVLEIGSGTGQHAVHFATQMPHLTWLATDQEVHHNAIRAWLADGPDNIEGPFLLDVTQADWGVGGFDAAFTANTIHIMSWPIVEEMFEGVGGLMPGGGHFITYGPFNYGGEFTSASNAQFEHWLKARDPLSGIRDFEAVLELANRIGFELKEDIEMPANNRILHWVRR